MVEIVYVQERKFLTASQTVTLFWRLTYKNKAHHGFQSFGVNWLCRFSGANIIPPILWNHSLCKTCSNIFTTGEVFPIEPGPLPGFRSRGAKNRKGGHIIKYIIGCIQQTGGQTCE